MGRGETEINRERLTEKGGREQEGLNVGYQHSFCCQDNKTGIKHCTKKVLLGTCKMQFPSQTTNHLKVWNEGDVPRPPKCKLQASWSLRTSVE